MVQIFLRRFLVTSYRGVSSVSKFGGGGGGGVGERGGGTGSRRPRFLCCRTTVVSMEMWLPAWRITVFPQWI